jgi:hypothetical protein
MDVNRGRAYINRNGDLVYIPTPEAVRRQLASLRYSPPRARQIPGYTSTDIARNQSAAVDLFLADPNTPERFVKKK